MDLVYERKKDAAPALLIGKVVANYDADYKGMVKVQYRAYGEGGDTTDWMKIFSPYAGNNKGIYFLPEVGDAVAVGFINGDANNPCVLGMLWNKQDDFPKNAVTEKNITKLIVTRSGAQIAFSDEEGKESIQILTPGKAEITLNDEKETIVIKKAASEIEINGKDEKITVRSNKAISVESENIEIKAKSKLDLSAKTLNLEADNINVKAKNKLAMSSANIEIKANAGLKAEASGIAEIKGSMVKING